jgi:P-aminobenzoate N-oxygenase AurF
MPVVLGAVLLMIGLVLLAWTRMVKRWKRNMDVSDDTQYVDTLATLSDGSVRRHFNPYTDIDWDAPKFSITQNDPRWVLPAIRPQIDCIQCPMTAATRILEHEGGVCRDRHQRIDIRRTRCGFYQSRTREGRGRQFNAGEASNPVLSARLQFG